MNKVSLAVAALGVTLVAATISPPQGIRIFTQTPPPNVLPIRALGRSHLSLVSDLFWIRTIGVSVNLKVPADALALVSWCDFVTDLDPTFLYPYLFGGLLGPMPSASGNHNTAEAAALLRKGMQHIPSDHRLPLYLSFNQLYIEHDVKAAAETLRQGARAPGAPMYMAQLATRLLAQANDFDAASAFAEELAQSSDDPREREIFERRRLEIERDRILHGLQSAVDRYRAQRGFLPATLVQLLSEGVLTELPPDPLGGEFQLREDGTVVAPSGERLHAYIKEGTP
jgi:hypothetical protein